jgi:pilus assembly protein CpaB
MHFDRRFAMVIGLSLGWAFVVSAIFYRLAGQGRSGAAKTRKSVVVAVERLPVGANITRQSVKLVSLPVEVSPKDGFSKIEDVLDRPVIETVQADEPLVAARLAERGSGMGLAPMIPSGMRAISVRVNDVVGVAGFILPGMHVDVLVTGRPPNRNDTFTRTVLQDIAVLSAGQTIQADVKNPSIKATVVTLLVSPAQAEALTLANNEGHIQLVLRNSTDRQTAATGGKELHDLYGVGGPLAPAPLEVAAVRPEVRSRWVRKGPVRQPLPIRAPKQDLFQMTIIRGTKETTVQFPPASGGGQ